MRLAAILLAATKMNRKASRIMSKDGSRDRPSSGRFQAGRGCRPAAEQARGAPTFSHRTKEGVMNYQPSLKALLIPVAMAVIALPGVGRVAALQAAEPEMKIEVTMKDKAYHVKGHTLPGALTAIVLRNEDT